jgi:hypothetical protein
MTEEPLPTPNLADLAAALPEEIAEAILYALRYDERGKPRRGGWDFAVGLAAERLAAGRTPVQYPRGGNEQGQK